jgi:hypothetical protein
LQIKFKNNTFLVADLSKNMALPAYSPIPFGVNSPAVKAAGTVLLPLLWRFYVEKTRFCHFKISKNDSRHSKQK